MSRNLGRTDCDFCGDTPELGESPRPIKRAECGAYYEEFKWLIVAAADCPSCCARYLAWFSTYPGRTSTEPVDLSFRSTFNDEPGASDLPLFEVKRRVVYERTGPFAPEAHGYGRLVRKP